MERDQDCDQVGQCQYVDQAPSGVRLYLLPTHFLGEQQVIEIGAAR